MIREKARNIIYDNALATESWERSQIGMGGKGEYRELYYSQYELEAIVVETGISIEKLKKACLEEFRYDLETLEKFNLPLDYCEWVYEEQELMEVLING